MKKKVKNALGNLREGQVAVVELKKEVGPQHAKSLGAVKRVVFTGKDAMHAARLLEEGDPGKEPKYVGFVTLLRGRLIVWSTDDFIEEAARLVSIEATVMEESA